MAFISVEFLNSMVEMNIIKDEDKKIFLENIHSISSEMKTLLKKDKKSFK